MAELNFGLLTPPGSQSIGNAFVSGMDQAAAARQMENQNALSQYTLSKARREDEMQNQLYDAVRQPGFKLDIGTAMRFGAPGLAAFKAQQDASKNAVDIAYTQARTGAIPGEQAYKTEQTAKLSREAQVEREKYAYEKLSQLGLNPGGASDDDVRTAISDAVSSGNLSMAAATRAQTALLNTPIEKRSGILTLMAGTAGDRIKALMPDMQLVTKSDGSIVWVNKAPMSPGFGGDQGLPGYAAGMTPTQFATTGMKAAELRDQGISIPGFYAPGTPAVTGAPQNNATPAVVPTNATIRQPATTGLSPKANRELALKQAEAQITNKSDNQKTEIALSNDYTKESKGFIETKLAIDKARSALKDAATNPTAGLSAGTAFMKMLDPNSVVRETELAMALKSSGWFDRATNIAQTLQSGKTILTPTQISNLNKTMDGLYEEVKDAQRTVDEGYKRKAKSYGLNVENIITERGQSQKAEGKETSLNLPPIQSFRRRP